MRKVFSARETEIAGDDILTSMALACGLALLASVTLAYVLAALWLMAGFSIGQISLVFIMAASLTAAAGMATLSTRRFFLPVLGISAAFTLTFMIVASQIGDTTIDGQWYHFQAKAALLEGWSAYRETFRGAPSLGEAGYTVWPQHYPRAHWIVMVLPSAAGLSLEAGKYVQFVMLAGAGLTAFAALRLAGLSLTASLFAALALAANPVALVQLFTRLNDGLLISCLLAFSMLVLLWALQRRAIHLVMMGLVIMFAVGLKFTAIPFFVVACGLAVAALVWWNGLEQTRLPAAAMLGAGLLGVFGLGFAPYVVNIVEFGHPFYPLIGGRENAETLDIITGIAPPVLDGKSGPSALFFSLFSETHTGWPPGEPSLKWPFTLRSGELYAAGAPDTQIAGFGPFFSGALAVCVILTGLLLLRFRTNHPVMLALAITFMVFVLTAAFPQSWWARYAPQTWLVPGGVALAALFTQDRLMRGFAFGIAGILLVNSALMKGSSLVRSIERDRAVMAQMDRFAAEGRDVVIDPDRSAARVHLLRANGFDVRVESPIDPASCSLGESLAAYGQDVVGGYLCIRRN